MFCNLRFPLIVVALALFPGSPAQAQVMPSETAKLFELVVIPTDLTEASRQMTIYDTDSDGIIDSTEREKLAWKSTWKDFDLNNDQKLTHLEVAVRQAKLREKDDVTEFDVKNVQTFLRRYDSNGNGQLEHSEVSAGGWPANPDDYDANHDGILTAKEMAIRFAYNRGLRREMGIEAVDQTGAMQWIKRYDENGNRKLDRDESEKAPLPKPFDDFDEDGDGRLADMELATLFARHRHESGLTKPDTFKVRRLFDRFDPQWDGKIDLSELEQGGLPQNTLQMLTQYDADKDGTVSIREVETALAKVRKERGYTEVEFQRAKKMLTRHDTNRSKFIEPAELTASAAADGLSKGMVAQADRNDDGKVGLDELARYFASQP